MLAGTLGLIPRSHPLYTFLSQQLLPVCLVLLLIGTDLRALGQMGAPALAMMLSGAAGTVLGGLVSYHLYRPWLPAEAWGGIGALTASWTGGSANMIAVKEALNLPDGIIGPLIIVDAAVAYSWMALLVWSSSQQARWDNWVAGPPSRRVARLRTARDAPAWRRFARRSTIAPPLSETKPQKEAGSVPVPVSRRAPPGIPGAGLGSAVALAIVLSLLAQWAARRMPMMGSTFSASTWTVLLVTTAALLMSLTPLRELEQAGASRLGTLLLYGLLASIGAQADLRSILHTPVFLAMGATWILLHGLCLLAVGRLARAPLGLIATASQANIGGTVSAPIVGATFSPRLASLGLLMAIFGNLIGTYIGLASAGMARVLERAPPFR